MALTPHLFMGTRPDGASGVFISPPGVNAQTAPVSQLSLAITETVPQIVLRGSALNGQVVPYQLGFRPIVILTSLLNTGVGFGFVRPVGNVFESNRSSRVVVTLTGMTISTDFTSVGYQILNQSLEG